MTKKKKSLVCEHNTLHFEGRNLAYLVCNGCGKKWAREVSYSQNNRYTYFKSVTHPRIID